MKRMTLGLFCVLSLAVLIFCVSAFAVGPIMPRDGEGSKIQAPSWDATLSELIVSTASKNFTISGKLWYEFVAATDCKGRLMNDTTKASWPQFNLYAKAPFRGSNWGDSATSKAIFLNISGCTGDFRAQ